MPRVRESSTTKPGPELASSWEAKTGWLKNRRQVKVPCVLEYSWPNRRKYMITDNVTWMKGAGCVSCSATALAPGCSKKRHGIVGLELRGLALILVRQASSDHWSVGGLMFNNLVSKGLPLVPVVARLDILVARKISMAREG